MLAMEKLSGLVLVDRSASAASFECGLGFHFGWFALFGQCLKDEGITPIDRLKELTATFSLSLH